MLQKKLFFPAVAIALFMVVSLAVINMGYLISGRPVTFIERQKYVGLDYHDFYEASEALLSSGSPYSVARYVTTPLPAIINTVLVPFGFDSARVIFAILLTLSMLLSYWIVWRLVGLHEKNFDGQVVLVTGFLVISISYPFYFLLERGNTDSVVMLLLCLSLYVMRAGKREWLGSLLFTLAILIKVYPLLLILPIFFYRRWKLLIWVGFWMSIFLFLFNPWDIDILKTLLGRSQQFLIPENGSIVNSFFIILMLLKPTGLPVSTTSAVAYALIAYTLLICCLLYADIRFGQKAAPDLFKQAIFLYFPFMVVLPKTAYHYEMICLILLIPILCVLWETVNGRKARIALLSVIIGLALTQLQAAAAYFLTNNVLAYAIPGFGALIAMIGIASYRLEIKHYFSSRLLSFSN